jgi:hypothetical protein
MSHAPLAPVQFRLRQAVIVVTCAAVVLAIAAPRLRPVPAERWMWVGVAAGLIGSMVLGGVVLLARLRRAALAKAGTVRHRAAVHAPWLAWLWRIMLLAVVFNGAMTLWLTAIGSEGLSPTNMIMAMSVGAMLVTSLSNSSDVLIADQGLVISVRFYPWRRLHFERTDDAGDLHVKLKHEGVVRIRCTDEAGRAMIAERAVR